MMRSIATLSALLLPLLVVGGVVGAEKAEDTPVPTLSKELAELAAEAEKMETESAVLGSLPEAPFDPAAPMPEPPPGQSAAVADGGLLFDNARSRLAYIGNVRLKDPNVELRAAHRLYICLPQNQKQEEQTPTPAKAEPKTSTAPAPAPKPAEQPQQEKPEKPEPMPAYVVVENAAVDVPGSRVLLRGRNAQPSLTLTRAQESVTLQVAENGDPAQIFANDRGDALLLGSAMVFVWHDASGAEWKLEAATGPVYYEGAVHRMVALGASRVTSPNGVLTSTRRLVISFAAPESQPKPKANTPFAAFAGMQFKEVKHARAEGQVSLITPAADGRPAGSIYGGDTLDFDGKTGECLLFGSPCTLTYGGNTMTLHGSIRLQENGDAKIVSESTITGAYERPHPDKQVSAPLRGTWSTNGPILYDAQNRCYTFPGGFAAQDAVTTFSCTQEMKVYTAPKPGAVAPEHKPGTPNLAIAQPSELTQVIAHGQVQLQSLPTESAPAIDLSGDALDACLTSAVVKLRSAEGESTSARYGDYVLTVRAPKDGRATIDLMENGDILAQGDKIDATLPGKEDKIIVRCTNELYLQREQALLTLGEDSYIESTDGIMTSRAPLMGALAPGEQTSRAPSRYPQLDYNFAGLRRVATTSGGTIRTAQASLQCEGAMEVELIEGEMKDDPRKNLRTALARNRVSVAGKDATGRLVRATGDRLDYDPSSGCFYLRGRTVTLADRYNTHYASGAGACITIDPHNNVRISGQRQTTTANRVQEQLDKNKKK